MPDTTSSQATSKPPVDIDPPACFYLGRDYDLKTKELGKPVMYDAHWLTTHGVVVGMTGSGKTGLCVGLLEEAALDSIPCIIVDLKGDLTNLFLQFPQLKPEDFKPWLDPEVAKRKKLTLDEMAEQTAASWKKGLADSYQQPERIQRLHDAAEWRLYTPGSEVGRPVSILQSFSAPKGNIGREELNERVESTTTALLGLTSISGDPLQSKEHILVANLLLNAWTKGQDMDLAKVISQIQDPPISRIGAFEVDTFYPPAERLKLAVSLNNILASPSFSTWIMGEGLDFNKILRSPEGKPRQSIFYLAHLEESQRMFFLTLLLSEFLSWTRSQSGTNSLRALLYVDEVFGYLPPHPGNPPSKQPFLTLLKQARAFGVGVLVATQNPVDLDYKALTNAGTWFVGKLQTERDKSRLIEGLQGAANAAGGLADKNELEKTISMLGNRVFLMNCVHESKPRIMTTRWALTYLAGPMTREQLKRLPPEVLKDAGSNNVSQGEGRKQTVTLTKEGGCAEGDCPASTLSGNTKFCGECGGKLVPKAQAAEVDFKKEIQAQSIQVAGTEAASVAPILNAGVTQYYLKAVPIATTPGQGKPSQLVYQPYLLGVGEVSLTNARAGVVLERTYRMITEAPGPGLATSWNSNTPVAEGFVTAPDAGDAVWMDLPKGINDTKRLKDLSKEFADFLYNNANHTVYHNKSLSLTSEEGETHEEFVERCKATAQKEAEAEAGDMFRKKAEKEAKTKKSAADMAQAQQEYNLLAQQGTSLIGQLFNWRKSDQEAAQKQQASSKYYAAKSEFDAAQKELNELTQKVGEITEKWKAKAFEELKEIKLAAKKSDIRVTHFGIGWVPYWKVGERLIPGFAKASS
ncbi:MAG: DUF87 domain-containing protein [Gemmatales bacterium]